MNNQINLTTKKRIKEEVKEYDRIMTHKISKSKYESLSNMKQKLYEEISDLSEEELDFLREYILSHIIRTDKALSQFFPIEIAIAIAMFCSIFNNNYIAMIGFAFVALLFIAEYFSNDGIKRTNYFNLLLELINKVEETRGRTFNDSLVENNETKND